MSKTNVRDWKVFENSGNAYCVIGGILYDAPLSVQGQILIEEKSIVESLGADSKRDRVLEKINKHFGTSFRYSEFS